MKNTIGEDNVALGRRYGCGGRRREGRNETSGYWRGKQAGRQPWAALPYAFFNTLELSRCGGGR
jgi:hypothetical protein